MPPALLSRAEQCFRSLIPHQQSQLRTGCSQIAANPETGRTHINAYAFKKCSSSKLLSNFSLVTGENSNVLPGNMAWGEMLRSHVPCAPHELCRWHQGEDEPRELCGTALSTPGCPPAAQLAFLPGWKYRWRALVFLPTLQELTAHIHRQTQMGDSSRADGDCK